MTKTFTRGDAFDGALIKVNGNTAEHNKKQLAGAICLLLFAVTSLYKCSASGPKGSVRRISRYNFIAMSCKSKYSKCVLALNLI